MPYGYYVSGRKQEVCAVRPKRRTDAAHGRAATEANRGYFGLVDGNYILFATEGEYYEYLKERVGYDEK